MFTTLYSTYRFQISDILEGLVRFLFLAALPCSGTAVSLSKSKKAHSVDTNIISSQQGFCAFCLGEHPQVVHGVFQLYVTYIYFTIFQRKRWTLLTLLHLTDCFH